MRGTTATLWGMTWALQTAPWYLLEPQHGEASPQGTGHKVAASLCLIRLHWLGTATGLGSCSGDQHRALGAGAQTSPSLREVTVPTGFQQSHARGCCLQPTSLQAGVLRRPGETHHAPQARSSRTGRLTATSPHLSCGTDLLSRRSRAWSHRLGPGEDEIQRADAAPPREPLRV